MHEKVYIVTGTSTGIGRGIVACIARSGYPVIAGLRSPGRHKDLIGKGLNVTEFIGDLRSEEVRQQLEDTWSSVDAKEYILINNAGICKCGPVEFLPQNDFRDTFDVNFFSPVDLTQRMIQFSRSRSRKAHVIFVGSAASRVSLPYLSSYASSKHAIRSFVESLSRELKGGAIGVSHVELGSVNTPIWGKIVEGMDRLEREKPNMMKIYGQHLKKFLVGNDREAKKRDVKAEDIATVIFDISLAETKKMNYVIGSDAKLNFWSQKFISQKVVSLFIESKIKNEKI